ncbi:EamA-like transporter family protein [Oceanospirillum multiglobuliferum]|nr:EamA-like transporter family protein [Oceanospirillum multiglobuliferum]
MIISACLHAGWNLIGKKQSPSQAFFMLSTLFGVLILSPWLLWVWQRLPALSEPFWLWLLLSGFFQAIYVSGLAWAYEKGDLSLSYPLARALPVAFVPLVYWFIFQQSHLQLYHFLALSLIILGAILTPLTHIRDWRWQYYYQPTMLFVLLAALGTTGYSIVDGIAVQTLTQASQMTAYEAGATYVLLQGMSCLLWLAPWALSQSKQRQQAYLLLTKPLWAIAAGIFIMLTYLLILASFALVDEVSFVVAFRQISIPIGVLASIIWLQERLSVVRGVAVGLMFCGVVLISI